MFKPYGEHRQLISRDEIGKILGIEFSNFFMNQLLREEKFHTYTFSKATDFIISLLILFRFRYFESEIRRNNKYRDQARSLNNPRVFNGRHYKNIQKMVKMAKELGISTDVLKERLLSEEQDYVHTGCYHLANKLGLNPEKVNNVLNLLHDKRCIHRTIIKQYLNTEDAKHYVSNGDYRPFYGCNGHYYLVLGSRIEMPSKWTKITLPELRLKRHQDIEDVTLKEVITYKREMPYHLTPYQKVKLGSERVTIIKR